MKVIPVWDRLGKQDRAAILNVNSDLVERRDHFSDMKVTDGSLRSHKALLQKMDRDSRREFRTVRRRRHDAT